MPVLPASAQTAGDAYSGTNASMADVWSSSQEGLWTLDASAGVATAPKAANKPLYLHKSFTENFSNYTFEAQVTLPEATATLGGICFGVQDREDITDRYEFTVSYNNGGWCPRIYKRVIGVDGYSGYFCVGDHQTVNNKISITAGVPFTMKIVVNGLKMTAYINDTQVLSDTIYFWEDDASYNKRAITGGVGLMGFNNTAAEFDNVKLYSGSSLVFEEDFSDANDEPYYGTVIWQDSFNEKDTSWEGGVYTTSGIQYDFVVADGMASVTAPETGSINVPMSVSLIRPESEIAQESYYRVQANVRITGDSKTPTVRKGAASVQFAKDSTTGEIYELRITAPGVVNIYRGSTQLISDSIVSLTGEAFQYNKDYLLCINVYDSIVQLSINNWAPLKTTLKWFKN